MQVGEALRERRLARGWTQRMLGEEAGISAPFVSDIDLGKKVPSFKTLSALAAALGCGEGALMGGQGEVPPPEAASAPDAPRGASWWGCVVDEARAVAQRGDPLEIALARSMLGFASAALDEAPPPDQAGGA